MHLLHARSALGRGMHMVAGMLSIFTTRTVEQEPETGRGFQLVSWQPGARSRREDELARHREMSTG